MLWGVSMVYKSGVYCRWVNHSLHYFYELSTYLGKVLSSPRWRSFLPLYVPGEMECEFRIEKSRQPGRTGDTKSFFIYVPTTVPTYRLSRSLSGSYLLHGAVVPPLGLGKVGELEEWGYHGLRVIPRGDERRRERGIDQQQIRKWITNREVKRKIREDFLGSVDLVTSSQYLFYYKKLWSVCPMGKMRRFVDKLGGWASTKQCWRRWNSVPCSGWTDPLYRYIAAWLLTYTMETTSKCSGWVYILECITVHYKGCNQYVQ